MFFMERSRAFSCLPPFFNSLGLRCKADLEQKMRQCYQTREGWKTLQDAKYVCLKTQQHNSTNPLIGSSLTKPNHELDYSNNTLENIPDKYFKGLNFYRVIKVDS